MADYIYIVKTIDDNQIQIAAKVDTVDGVMLCDGKICAVLKRYIPPVDITEVMADFQRFSGSAPAQPKPVEMKPEPMKPAPTKPADIKAEPVRKEPKRSSDGMIRYLSDLREGPGSCYSKVYPKDHGSDSDRKRQALGDTFFADCDCVLIDKPGNTADLRLEAICRLESYWESMTTTAGSRRSLAEYGKCSSNNYITFEYAYDPGGSCYDGGCHSYDPSSRSTLSLHRITEADYLNDQKTAKDIPLGHAPFFRYQTDLPFQEETEVVMWNTVMSLKNPMGIAGYYRISISHD